MSGASASAQGKGPGGGAGPSINQGHAGAGGHDHDHDSSKTGIKTGTNPKGDRDDDSHANWQTRFNNRMQNDPAFAKKIDALLGGMDPKTAEMGFENRGQFIAALHVSKNLGIPFDQLKAKVTGITVGANGQTTQGKPESLGKAIHDLKPTLTSDQVKDAVKKADKQASEDTEKPDTDKDTD
jgi:hypothetical protein